MKLFRTIAAILVTLGVLGGGFYLAKSALAANELALAEAKAEQVKADQAKANQPKADAKVEQAKADQPKSEVKAEQPKPEVKADQTKPEVKADQTKAEVKSEKPKADQPKAEVKAEKPKAEQPKPEVKADQPKPVVAVPAPAEKTAPAPAGGASSTVSAGDHAMFGGSPSRNFVNLTATGIPIIKKGEEEGKPADANVLYTVALGSKSYGGPTISGGKVFVGTNNGFPRNKRDIRKNADGEEEPIDKGVLMCFDEKTGAFLWQAIHDKLPSGPVNDWPHEGICSTPQVEGNRVYYVTNRCTVVCADVNGMADGNQGVQTEQYKDKTDVDIIWEYDMMAELKVFPHNMTASSTLIVGDYVYLVTANGVDENHINIPAPQAPSFICLEKVSGKLKWKNSQPGKEIMHGQWSNPVYGEIKGVKQVIFPGGDGWLYSFEPTSGELLWKFDANPKPAIYELGGAGTRNDFIGTPVVHDGKVFIGVGQDPEHFTGIGHFWCFDPAGKNGDISPELVDKTEKLPDGKTKMTGKPNPNSAVVWHFGGEEKRKVAQRDFVFGRTMSTATIVDGILYIAELQGQIHCLDAKTGKQFWQYDTKGAIWGSTYYVDGKIFLATESGEMFVFKHTKTPQAMDELQLVAANDKELREKVMATRKNIEATYLLSKYEFDAPVRSTPIVANGVLYVMTEKSLTAFKKK